MKYKKTDTPYLDQTDARDVRDTSLADLLNIACGIALRAARRLGRAEEDASWLAAQAEITPQYPDRAAAYAAAYGAAFADNHDAAHASHWAADTLRHSVESLQIAAAEIDRRRKVRLYLVEPPERQAALAAMDQVSPALWVLRRVVGDAERRFAALRASAPPMSDDDCTTWRAVRGLAGEIVAAVAGVEAHIEKNRVAGFAEAAP